MHGPGSLAEALFLAFAVFTVENVHIAIINIVLTLVFIWLIIKRLNSKVRIAFHCYFACLNSFPLLYLGYSVAQSLRTFPNVSALRHHAAEIGLPSHFPADLFASEVKWSVTSAIIVAALAILTISAAILWLYDIKAKKNIYDYSRMPRWQKALTIFLIFYGLTYFHMFIWAFIFTKSVGLWLMYSLWTCPTNLVIIALLTPLVPNVNKKLFIITCLNGLTGHLFNYVIGLSVNIDAQATVPVAAYGLFMLWLSTRKRSKTPPPEAD